MKGQFGSVESFASEGLPGLLSGRKGARVLFASYNEIDGFPSGSVEVDDSSLRIQVLSGGRPAPDFGFMLDWVAHFGTSESSRFSKEFCTRAENAQAAVAGELSEGRAFPDIAIIYAGLAAFESVIKMIDDMRKQTSESHVVVLTCDCSIHQKMPFLNKQHGVDTVVVTYECGGYGGMGNLVNALKEQWPKRILD